MASFCFIIALGLHLTLFIEQPEYIGLLTHESGVRVAIHANDIFPYPEDVGLSASTGQSTAIGVRQTELTRLPTPWGICSDGMNYLYESNYTYSQRSCEKKCLMDRLAERCGCITEIYPEYEESTCSYLNSTQRKYSHFLSVNVLCSSPYVRTCSESELLTRFQARSQEFAKGGAKLYIWHCKLSEPYIERVATTEIWAPFWGQMGNIQYVWEWTFRWIGEFFDGIVEV
ncbi:putative degenerin mec-10-like [Apostichopus japonicus]|uniref:Putative degenerin mec-10-like n=1 Tax=Stichopus japonicus TaxID=307972 RepID=A0A2G8KF10_STIJA|nr:putative degenerin mec-10-like [Apostichopus japonicus]